MAVLAMSAVANAGTMYAWLVIDPTTTAGAGIAAIPGGGSNMVVSSSRSGAGTFHLYAVDDTDGSAGIRSFQVKINGTVSGVLNRSATGNFDTEANYGDGAPSNVGLDLNRPVVLPLLTGAQSPSNTKQIDGFGISASNFQLKTSAGSYQATPISGQWGLYAPTDGPTSGAVFATGHIRNAILLGEGQYTGAAPTIDITTDFAANGTGFTSWTAAGFPGAGSFTTAVGTNNVLSNTNPFVPEPATLTLVGLGIAGIGGIARRRRS
jgi:hypothetical protein